VALDSAPPLLAFRELRELGELETAAGDLVQQRAGQVDAAFGLHPLLASREIAEGAHSENSE